MPNRDAATTLVRKPLAVAGLRGIQRAGALSASVAEFAAAAANTADTRLRIGRFCVLRAVRSAVTQIAEVALGEAHVVAILVENGPTDLIP